MVDIKEKEKRKKNKERFNFFWQYAKPYKGTLLSAEICMIIMNLFDIIKPLVLAVIIDESFYRGNREFFFKGILLYLILFLGGSIVNLLLSFTWMRIQNKFVMNIWIKLFERVLHSKASFLSNMKIGDLQSRINDEAAEFMYILFRNVFPTFNQLLSYVLSIIIIFRINKTIAVFLFFMIPLVIILTNYLGNKANKLSRDRAGRYGVLSSRVYEFINGMRELHLLNARAYAKKYILLNLTKLIRLDILTSRIDFGIKKGNELINLIATLGLYGLSAVMIFNGQLTIGYFIAITQYFYRLHSSLNWLAENYIEWEKRKVYIDRVMEIMNLEVEEDTDNSKDLSISEGNVLFKNVVFSYEKEQDVLQGISFEVKSGEKIALVGASGTGKSTITNLLLRFYDPITGTILIDGEDIRSYKYKKLRNQIGVVQQDIQLFNDSIRFNLLFGKKTASDEELWEALEKANIADLIRTFPDGLETVIGNKGTGLSGGQKQRIMIARIFLKNPKILILDEATSALDFESEQLVRKAFDDLSKGRTTIVIAHRLSTIVSCEKVIVLNNGSIVSQGTHEELLNNSEYYEKLFRDQYFLKEA